MGAASSSGNKSGISDTEQGRGQEPASNVTAAREPAQVQYETSFFFKYVTAIARLWGILTFVGLWGCTVRSFTQHYKYAQYYLLAVAVLVTFLECVWILHKCFHACCGRNEGCCWKVWNAVVWIDDWKKALLYILLSAPCLTNEMRHLFPLLAAGLLIVSAVLYFLKSFRESSCVQKPIESTSSKSRLIAEEPPHYDSIAQARNEVRGSSAESDRHVSVTSSDNERRSPVTSSDNEKRSPTPRKSLEEDEEVPVGYKHDYGLPKQTATHVTERPKERPRSSNPFDEENDVTDAPESFEHKPPRTNPFEDDYVDPGLAQGPKPTNPFE